MEQKEIQMWIDKWLKLNPTCKRDLVIKIWCKFLKTNKI